LLLADDSIAIQKVVSLTFSDEGLDVVTVGSGEQALHRLEDDNLPSIILADIFMPAPNGYELCERIKSDRRFQHIPVLLLVGTFEPFNETEARRVGADGVVTKPFQSIKDLVSKVGSLLGGGSRAEEEATTQDLPATPKSPPSPPPVSASAATRSSFDTGGSRTQQINSSPTSPLPWNEPSITASGTSVDADSRGVGAKASEQEIPVAASAAEVSFADIGMDDQMIEERPVAQNDEDAPAPFVLRPDLDEDDAAAPERDAPIRTRDADEMKDEDEDVTLISGSSSFFAQTPHAEDSLLDLDEGEPPQAMTEADDFILDLTDDAPAPSSPSTATRSAVFSTAASTDENRAYPAGASASVSETNAMDEAAPEMFSAGAVSEVDTQGAFAEAAHGDSEDDATDEMPTMIAVATAPPTDEDTGSIAPESDDRNDAVGAYGLPRVLEKSGTITNTRVPGLSGQASGSFAEAAGVGRETSGLVYQEPDTSSVAQPESAGGTEQTSATAATGGGQITLEQLSPEVIDAIARRAVEHLSERVVSEIAWEVVPDLAELLIKKRLDEQR
jgi:CheY-like chemotaxis protein